MTRLVLPLILSCVLAPSGRVVHAQENHTYRIDYFDASDGLPADLVYSIQEDSLGFLWVGTRNGLARFDGYEFETFSPRPDDSTSITGKIIETIHVDARGRVWAGGASAQTHGVSYYDTSTEQFVRFQHDPYDPNSLLDNEVMIIESSPSDPDIIWIGSRDWPLGQTSGISRLNMSTHTFTHFTTKQGLSDNQIRDILATRDGAVWAMDVFGQLNRFDPESQHFIPFHPGTAFSASHRGRLYEDSSGTLWIAAPGGLGSFDPDSETFHLVESLSEHDEPGVMLEDRKGIYWVGGRNGLSLFDPVTKTFTPFKHQLPEWTHVNALLLDRNGILWAGGSSGLMKIERRSNPFAVYTSDPFDLSELGYIRHMLEYSKNTIWLSTGNSLHAFDREKRRIKSYSANEMQISNRTIDYTGGIGRLFKDNHGMVWTGSNCIEPKLYEIDLSGPVITRSYEYHSDDPNTILAGCLNMPVQSTEGDLLIPQWGSGGMTRFNPDNGLTKRYTPETHGLVSDRALRIYEAPSEPGIAWVGTEHGLSRVDLNSDEVANYPDVRLFRSMMMHEDRAGRFWIATANQGVHLFDREAGDILKTYTMEEGLANDQVFSIYEDNQGYLWLGTANGLSRFDPDRETFTNFYEEDGLPGNLFYESQHFQSESGELFYSASGKLVSFLPEDVFIEPVQPVTRIKGLRINELPVVVDEDSPLQTSMLFTEHIDLTHDQDDVTFEFVGLQLIDPSQTRYRYQLAGYDEDWIYAGTQRNARYTNLPSGTYTFRVASRNGSSDWDETSVRLTIQPPWWNTVWAYLSYGLVFAFGILGVDRMQRRRLIAKERLRAEREKAAAIEHTNYELQNTLEHLKETQAQLIHSEKMASLGQLTAGIAHEIKNPLNFVNNFSRLSVSAAEELLALKEKRRDLNDEDVDELIHTLKLNAEKVVLHGDRADGIIRSMLEHSRSEPGERRGVNFNQLIDEYINLAFHSWRAANQNGAPQSNPVPTITRQYHDSVGDVSVIPQEIGRVLINLLDNSFYAVSAEYEVRSSEFGVRRAGEEEILPIRRDGFAPEVIVTTKRMNNVVEVRITDNGPGIPCEVQQRIFEPFFTTKPTGQGTGLGLSLSHDIVVKGHGGTLTVESAPGEGTTFVLRIPG